MGQQGTPELICHVGPVTALAVCSQKLLWGCGSEIHVFDLTTSKLEIRQQVLSGASIHGIRKGPTDANQRQLLCVYGAKQARVVSIDVTKHNEDITFLSDIREFCDWIWDVCWLIKKPKDDNIALALAHNSVLRWDWRFGQILSQRDSVEKCILYCAHFIGSTWENLMLAAGTVFNQIVLWPVANKNQMEADPVDIMHTFSGHQGVIFSIRYNSDLQRLCSVSDDRSIRMWQLTFPSGNQLEPTLEDWKSVRSDLLLLLYGHSARVWDVVLTSAYFASVGEDAICCVWSYSGTILHKFKGHKGRSIWRLTATEDEKFVVTGGGDASIRIWEVHEEKTKKTFQRIVSVPPNIHSGQDDFPRTVQMLSFDLILIMMNSGDLFSYSVSGQQFTLLVSGGKFKSYSIVSPCPDQTTVALGSMAGDVRILQLPETQDEDLKCFEVNLFSGKVLAITWLDSHHFLASGPAGASLVHRVGAAQNTNTEDIKLCVKLVHQLTLPPSKHRWITAGCLVSAADGDLTDTSHAAIVCGDKDGSVHCYNLGEGSACGEGQCIKPSRSFPRVHGKAGVTFVCYKDGLVYTAGRDGFYRQWQMKEGDLSQLHGNKIVKGFEWIDRLEWHNGDLLVYGFFSSLFMVWSVSYNQQLMSVHCGGGHRAWGCCHDNEMLRFAYLKAGKVYVVDSGHQAKQVIVQPELHGRKVCDVKVMALLSKEKDKPIHVVCTAGEDTTITIGAFVNINNLYSWRPITTLKGHKSIVISLALSSNNYLEAQNFNKKTPDSDEDNHLILFSGGGRAEIRVWKLKIVTDISHDVLAATQDIESLEEINSFCGSVQDSLQDDAALDGCTDDPPVSHTNKIVGEAPGMSSVSGVTAFGSLDQVQCNYQHISTHFLGEPYRRFHRRKSHKQRLDPETRIMSLAASSLASFSNGNWADGDSGDEVLRMQDLSRVHILSCAGSDGALRVFAFDEHSGTFSDLADPVYHQGCILKVLHYVHFSGENRRQCYAVSASTNGTVVFWSLDSLVARLAKNILSKQHSKSFVNSPAEKHKQGNHPIKTAVNNHAEYCQEDSDADSDVPEDAVTVNLPDGTVWQPVLSLKAHQSGVNGLHILQVSESQFLLASGGDDNAVTIQLLETSNSGPTLVAKVTKTDAHAAQVTGIHLVSATLVVSASIDQRVCVWNINQTPDSEIQLQLVACKYVDVADISSMSAYLHKDAVYMNIAGEGLCLYRLPLAGGTCQ